MKTQRTLAQYWLWLGVIALALAGIFAIPLFGARTPQLGALGDMFPWMYTVFAFLQKIFPVALVVHVNLSELLWAISILGMGCALLMEKFPGTWAYWPKAALFTTAAATACLVFSPLDPHWAVIKSNYIPVLQNSMFMLALGLLAAGLLVLLIPVIFTYAKVGRWRTLNMVEIGWLGSAAIILLALIAHGMSAENLPAGLPADALYETLFWAGGHIMLFGFSMLMMAAWLALLAAMGAALPARRWVVLAYVVTLLGAFASFAGFAVHPFGSGDFTVYQTRIMIEFGGLGVTLLGILVVLKIPSRPKLRVARAYVATLVMSLILFAAGGGLGLAISGQNVTIPAHYHGEIVGITLALMGLAYSMLPRFGYQSVAGTRLAFYQPIVYGVGQLMHIGALAYSGGYGVLRKTPGEMANSLTPDVKIAMGVMGVGGSLAVLGGILFVIVMLRAKPAPSASHQQTSI